MLKYSCEYLKHSKVSTDNGDTCNYCVTLSIEIDADKVSEVVALQCDIAKVTVIVPNTYKVSSENLTILETLFAGVRKIRLIIKKASTELALWFLKLPNLFTFSTSPIFNLSVFDLSSHLEHQSLTLRLFDSYNYLTFSDLCVVMSKLSPQHIQSVGIRVIVPDITVDLKELESLFSSLNLIEAIRVSLLCNKDTTAKEIERFLLCFNHCRNLRKLTVLTTGLFGRIKPPDFELSAAFTFKGQFNFTTDYDHRITIMSLSKRKFSVLKLQCTADTDDLIPLLSMFNTSSTRNVKLQVRPASNFRNFEPHLVDSLCTVVSKMQCLQLSMNLARNADPHLQALILKAFDTNRYMPHFNAWCPDFQILSEKRCKRVKRFKLLSAWLIYYWKRDGNIIAWLPDLVMTMILDYLETTQFELCWDRK